jgi:flagellar basal body rod protein FlgG
MQTRRATSPPAPGGRSRGDGSVAYTRDGAFRLDAQGRLVTGSGERVDPTIALPPGADDVRIGPRGNVSAAIRGALVPLGRIGLAGFSNPEGYIVQGGLEASGTDYADSAVMQITASRSYTALASVFRTADEMQGSLLDMLA